VLIKLFSLGVTDEALRANIGWKSAISLQRGPVDPKFQAEGIAATIHSSSKQSRLNDLTYGIKIWTDLSSVLSQSTRLSDRRTDGRTEFSSLYSVCIACSAVKIKTRWSWKANRRSVCLPIFNYSEILIYSTWKKKARVVVISSYSILE